MQLDDWRTAPAGELAPHYAAERARWMATLRWETATTWQAVESARQAGTLPGFVLRDEGGIVRGWSFHLQHRGELQFGSLVAPTSSATEQLLSGVFQSPEAKSADRWMAFGWFNAPGVVGMFDARGMGIERYRYLHRDLTQTIPAADVSLECVERWHSPDAAGLARLLSSAYPEPSSARPFAANGTVEEWSEYATHLLHGTACGRFDASISRVIRREALQASPTELDGAAIVTRLMPTTAHLAQLAVHPDARGRGLGEGLLVSMLTEARDAGCECVTLLVAESNSAARLYRRVGFVERAQFVSAASAPPAS